MKGWQRLRGPADSWAAVVPFVLPFLFLKHPW